MNTMTIELALMLYFLGILVALALGYLVVRLGVGHALRSHSIWTAEGGVDAALTARASRAARDAAELESYRQETKRG